MANEMDTPIVTTVGRLDDLASVISALDDGRNDDAARIRLCGRAHDIIADILGPQKDKVYDQGEDALKPRDLSVVGYVSAEGDCYD
jgi:hypothetical protein